MWIGVESVSIWLFPTLLMMDLCSIAERDIVI
jgi:hypothetical protein